MSVTAEILTEVSESIRSDAFVEVEANASIPNNVGLESDKQLQRALESWHPNYLDWWREIPGGHPNSPTCGHPKFPHLR